MSRSRCQRIALYSAACAAAAAFTSAPVIAAPLTYQTAVLADNPYVYYRLNESAGTTAEDTTAANRDGTYINNPTLGVAGSGVGSDTAVAFSPVTTSYLSSPITTFGASVPNSTYEFLLKADAPNYTTVSSIFGVINADPDGAGGRTQNQAVGIEANASGVNATNTPGTSRIWLRDEDGSQLWAQIEHGNLLDGNYHHLAFAVDMSAATATEKVSAYIDGVPVPITAAAESAALADNWLDFTVNAALAARNVRDTSVDRYSPITVDEMALYSTTLSPAQVAAHAAASAIPEPTSIALLGLAGLGMLRRRRA